MLYFSTRDNSHKVTSAQAISRGLAPDGGLYLPESIPSVSMTELEMLSKKDYRGRSAYIMKKFLDDYTQEELDSYVTQAYSDNYDTPATAPTHVLNSNTGILELWHGPTCAFKDMALQMLPRLLTAALKKCGETRKACILVATSGDTGKAALEGFHDVDGTGILVFYPVNGVSDVQKLQMVTQEGCNVMVCAVKGNFDDAQTGVKQIFGDREFEKILSDRGYMLTSANSINWGRLLPQVAYYISAYLDMYKADIIRLGEEINVCVPTGNFGNILAGWYAKQMGLPIKRFICASNENNVLTQFIETGIYDKNRNFYTTTSPSMDILVSSNLERLLYTLCGNDRQVAEYMHSLSENGKYEISTDMFQKLTSEFSAGWSSDTDAATAIASAWNEYGYLMDTHTAVGYNVLQNYRQKTGDKTPTVLVSTASPYKFCDSVLAALGRETDAPGTELLLKLAETTGTHIPRPLAGLAERKVRFERCVEKTEMLAVVDEFLG